MSTEIPKTITDAAEALVKAVKAEGFRLSTMSGGDQHRGSMHLFTEAVIDGKPNGEGSVCVTEYTPNLAVYLHGRAAPKSSAQRAADAHKAFTADELRDALALAQATGSE